MLESQTNSQLEILFKGLDRISFSGFSEIVQSMAHASKFIVLRHIGR
jgi:hypothetical protein